MGFSPILERGMDRERERERGKAGCVHFFGLMCYRTGSVRREWQRNVWEGLDEKKHPSELPTTRSSKLEFHRPSGIGSDSGEQSSRVQVCTSDSHNRLDGWRKSAGTYSLSYKLYKFSIGFDHLPNKPRAFFSPAKQKKIKEACNFICSPPLQISLETGKFKGHIFHFLDVQSLDSTHHWAKPFPGQDTTPIGAMSGCLGLGGDVGLWKR